MADLHRLTADLFAIPGIIGAWFVGVLPTVALTLTVVYTLIRMWESDTVQKLIQRWRKK